jgi:hypothetical protein
MRFLSPIRILLFVLLLFSLPTLVYSQASCSSPLILSVSSTCVTNGDLYNASIGQNGSCAGATTAYGVWYQFKATSTTASVTVGSFGGGSLLNAATTYIELLNTGACGSLTSVACTPSSSTLNATGLVVGNDYLIRVYVTTAPTGNSTKYKFDLTLQQTPKNDVCTNATVLTQGTSCTNTAGTLSGATISSPAVTSTCSGTPGGDVWYSFVATSAYPTITLSNFGSSFSSRYLQLFSGACGGLTSEACVNASTLTPSAALTTGNTYYIRIYTTTIAPLGCNWGFDICISTTSIAGDECTSSITLLSNSGCTNTSATLVGATASSGIPVGCAAAGTHYDLWFQFVAVKASETITFKKKSPTNITNPELQLFSGTCGTLTSLQCGTTSIAATGLTPGATYYVRVSQVGGSALTTRGDFDICVTHSDPPPATIDYSKSYVNITKGTGGGTVAPGDTLEIRATFVVRSGTVGLADSLAFFDTLYATEGLALVPGSLALRTNEGKLYKSFTDNYDTDAGWKLESANNTLDTVIQINFGANASNVRRGSLTNSSRPSVFGSTCIIMATYRVVVTAAYNNLINMGGGSLTLLNGGNYSDLNFNPTNVMVYASPGLCPNAVSPSNALGAESNGTFGTPSGSAPLARNRGTSPYTTYLYKPFNSAGGPNDYYYAIANNTSQNYTTINTWPKPDATNKRLFGHWDITGDHTNASSSLAGNPACDTTQAVSPTNPCGYMLVVNSAYKADTAFTYTITSLCPNTYYEISAWFKNICYKCGCDSTGTSSTTAGYIPTATGDSSGVRPNIAFDVNGADYYTTGDLLYLGLSGGQTGSDAANQWVKKGFTYLTGPAQTSFVLTLRNNAPGGGGNDWALDDIAVATCSPNMSFTPSIAPYVCDTNVVDIGGTVRSYFNNYVNYKWQKSTNGGTTWVDDGSPGTASPALISGEYEYSVAYPQFAGTMSDSGYKYRLVVGTTLSNLSSASCTLTGNTELTLNIHHCTPILGTDFISFNAKQDGIYTLLKWTTNKEIEYLEFIIEGSEDGRQFSQIAVVKGDGITDNILNSYSWGHPYHQSKYYYRIKMKGAYTGEKYSRIISIDGLTANANLVSVINPFHSQLSADVQVKYAGIVKVQLIDNFGSVVRTQNFTLQQGANRIIIKNVEALPAGMYSLKIFSNQNTITKKVVKQ